MERAKKDIAARQDVNAFVEAKKDSFSGAVAMYSGVANFLVDRRAADQRESGRRLR